MTTTRHTQTKARRKKYKRAAANVHGYRIRQTAEHKFVVRVRREGVNIRRAFSTIEDARQYCEHLHREREVHGMKALQMTDATRVDANKALAMLNGRASLAEAVGFWALHHPDGSAITLNELSGQYVEKMRRENLRPRTLSGTKWRLEKLCADLGTKPVCTITSTELANWLDVRGGLPVNRNNSLKVFRSFFNYAVARGIVTQNIAKAVSNSKTDEKMPDFWPHDSILKLMRAAEKLKPDMVPAVAIMAFAGLRPDECFALQWQNVNLADNIIRVMPETSKMRRARVVDIAPNLSAWLAAYVKPAGPVSPPYATFRRWRVVVMKAAGLSEWPVDVLRHSYATHWLAVHNDVAKLAALMGNSPAIIFRHYRGLATAKEAARYWQIEPQQKGNVIQLQQAVA